MTRIESDALGDIQVGARSLWGAQTQRCIENFPIGQDRYRWGRPVVQALGVVKKAAALANQDIGGLEKHVADLIAAAAQEVIAGQHDDQFPLAVWQSGSGTQSNMNANEVIANRANQLAGSPLGSKNPVHPNDHVNQSQSSNDVFPTVMHLAIVDQLTTRLRPALVSLRTTLVAKAASFHDVVKVGRTHLQDAAPITLGQEITGWVGQLDHTIDGIDHATSGLATITIGGTAVGTGLNAPVGFGPLVAQHISTETGRHYRTTDNFFAGSSAHDAVVDTSAAVRGAAMALMKISNDVRWLASGPHAGLGELSIPANEPGSSIMPGKVNPSQIEALTMVAVHVFGNDASVAFAASQGNFELNAYKPLMLFSVLDSIQLLAEACASFDARCAVGLEPNLDQIRSNLDRNLMLVTALNPHIGYDRASAIAKTAQSQQLTLREAAVASGYLTGVEFDSWVDPFTMTTP